MKIRYRWDLPIEEAPMHGCYIMSTGRPRTSYLILGVDNRGRRGGLSEQVYTLLILTVERRSVAEARANAEHCWPIVWDKRQKRSRSLAT